MKFRKIGLKYILSLAAVAALVVVILYFRKPAGRPYHRIEIRALRSLQSYIRNEIDLMPARGKLFQLIEGDVVSLERWLGRKYDELLAHDKSGKTFGPWLGWAEHVVKRDPSGEFRLVDGWGQRLVYRCPHDNPKYMWQLYSIGPNGIDEGGQGDDIGDSLTYDDISYILEDPKFDGNVYRKFRGQFTNVIVDGRVVVRHP